MEISLNDKMENHRISRVVIGLSMSMDISTIFENEERDFLTGEFITPGNFDEDVVYYIQDLGYTRRKSLLKEGFEKVSISSFSSSLCLDNFS